jgi:hypothetical protein
MANMVEEDKMANIVENVGVENVRVENVGVSLMEKINSITILMAFKMARQLNLLSDSWRITTFLITLTFSLMENSIILTSTITTK